ncbi:hypothetical protein DV736_g445, partial [Chaetothyriales sp. CBS 134916]
MDLAPLARCAAELSRSLATLGQQCEHTDTHSGIMDIANETLRLSSTLWRLREAVDIHKDQYTDAFSQDLKEISSELQLVCDEIAEGCVQMQKMDTPGPLPWFFKKGRVSKLQKHLVALKTTLVVMRTVLHHSKNYGRHNSPRCLAESNPHVVQEDRAILDSIFARNRHAIQELHDFEKGHQSSLSTPSDSSLSSGFQLDSHGRSLSNTTGLESALNSYNLAAATTQASSTTDTATLEPQRRFSKRGARLSIHISILSMAPRETAVGLRERWLQAPKSGRTSDSSPNMQMPTKTAISEHSKAKDIPEAADRDQVRRKRRRATASGRSLKRLSSPAANAVRRLIKKLSFRRRVPSPERPTCEEE